MIELPLKKSVGKLADWVELYICVNAARASKYELTSVLKRELGSIKESTIDSILTELERRHNLYGSASPFYVRKNTVEATTNFNWHTLPEYVMCLIYSIRGVITPDVGTKLFERLSDEALKKYLNGETVLLGWPGGKSLNINLLQTTTLNHEHYATPPTPTDKDKRVDSIGWMPHNDKRSGQIVVLMQSGAGKHWTQKKPIQTELWNRLVWWATPLIPALAIPEMIEKERWMKTTDEFKLVMDRARLIRHTAAITAPDTILKQEILDWCNIQLST